MILHLHRTGMVVDQAAGRAKCHTVRCAIAARKVERGESASGRMRTERQQQATASSEQRTVRRAAAAVCRCRPSLPLALLASLPLQPRCTIDR